MKKYLIYSLLISLSFFVSCDNDSDNNNPVIPTLTVNVTNVNSTSANITWNILEGNGDVLYNVYLNDALVLELTSDLTYSFNNLSELTTYNGIIEALDDNGVIASTNFAFTTLESGTEAMPSDFDASVKHLGHISTTIQWTTSIASDNGVISYGVFIDGQMVATNLSSLELYIPNLQANTTYSGYVRAYNGSVFNDANFSFTTVPSNILDDRVFLRTQQEVDDFAANHYTAITDWLIIGREDVTSDITDLSGLQSLVTVEGSLFITYNPVLETTHGLQNVTNDMNAIAIVGNTIMTDLVGFSGINSLSSYINIVDNPEITTLDAFSNMANGINFVNVELTNNDKLVDIDGLSQLDLFSVYIREHELLDNIDLINDSDTDNLAQLTIMNNANLFDFSPLNSITLIKGSITIGYSNITNLDDLSNLNRTFGDVNIWYNSSLTDLCGLQNIVQSDNIDGVYNVHDNAYNPTFEDVNSGNCSQ